MGNEMQVFESCAGPMRAALAGVDQVIFRGVDVCRILGLKNPTDAFKDLDFADGTIQVRKDLVMISFFDFGVLLGRFSTWQECRDALGDRILGKRCKEATYQCYF